MIDLTILAFGFRKSELISWIKRHSYLPFDVLKVICAYHHDDTGTVEEKSGNVIFIQGEESGLQRIRRCCGFIHTRYVLLAASDDQIVALPSEVVCEGATALCGTHFFNFSTHLVPSSNNSIDFRNGQAKAVVEYWSPPNPGDNCLFYSIFDVTQFARIYSDVGEFEGSDWYFTHRFLVEGTFSRIPSFVVVRQPPPRVNHYTRRFLECLERVGARDSDESFHNPILYALQQIRLVTPATLIPTLEPAWAAWIELKFNELAAASERYRRFVAAHDIQSLSLRLSRTLADLDKSRLVRL